MIIPEDVRILLDYNTWADRAVLTSAKALPHTVLHADQAVGYGKIFDTLAHMMDAQRVWLLRWQGVSPAQFSTRSEFENLDQLEAAWESVRTEFGQFIAASNLESPIAYSTTRGESYTHPLGLLLWNVLNHAVEHRSELATMFTQSGVPLPRLDLVYYLGTEAKLDQ